MIAHVEQPGDRAAEVVGEPVRARHSLEQLGTLPAIALVRLLAVLPRRPLWRQLRRRGHGQVSSRRRMLIPRSTSDALAEKGPQGGKCFSRKDSRRLPLDLRRAAAPAREQAPASFTGRGRPPPRGRCTSRARAGRATSRRPAPRRAPRRVRTPAVRRRAAARWQRAFVRRAIALIGEVGGRLRCGSGFQCPGSCGPGPSTGVRAQYVRRKRDQAAQRAWRAGRGR